MKPLASIAIALALAAPAAAGDVAIPLADGNVLRGERVDDPEVAGKGIRLRVGGGVTVFVPWSEMAAGTRELLEKGLSPAAPLVTPPLAPGPGPDLPPGEAVAAPPAGEASAEPPSAEPPALPDCCDPRF